MEGSEELGEEADCTNLRRNGQARGTFPRALAFGASSCWWLLCPYSATQCFYGLAAGF